MKPHIFLIVMLLTLSGITLGQKPTPIKPPVLISTDIGGTDPDDNQSIIHLFMYSDRFNL